MLAAGRRTYPLVVAVRRGDRRLAALLLSYGASLCVSDEAGMTPLMYAIRQNDYEMCRLLLGDAAASWRVKCRFDPNCRRANPVHYLAFQHSSEAPRKLAVGTPGEGLVRAAPSVRRSSPQDSALQAADAEGRTLVHHVVNPLPFGSYENTDLLRLLARLGAPVDTRDNARRTPLQYAWQQESKVLANCLIDLGAKPAALLARQPSALATIPAATFSYEADSETMVQRLLRAGGSAVRQRTPEPEALLQLAKAELVTDAHGEPYDALMTKVDLSVGTYGQNVFYKMQLVRDVAQEVYIVWTRWGRVGDTGQYQRTPFAMQGEAATEFEKIFRSKAGVAWAERHAAGKQEKKYALVKLSSVEYRRRDLLRPFREPMLPTSLSEGVAGALRRLADPGMLQQTVSRSGLCRSLLPLGMVSKEALVEARQVLGQVVEELQRCEELRRSANALGGDVQEMLQHVQRLNDLSATFYQLIPHQEYAHSPIQPFTHLPDVQAKFTMIDNLLDVEVASKLVLGAQLRQAEVNPLEYMLHAMEVHLEDVRAAPEVAAIQHYISRTSRDTTVQRLLRVQRRGEVERLGAWHGVSNRMLLWHGTRCSNVLSILHQGLRIAPPEAPASGYAFGKGVYFADAFAKSLGYTSSCDDGTAFLLLCEVVVGETKRVRAPEYFEAAPPGFHSVRGTGQRGPDLARSVRLPNGVLIPSGPLVPTPLPNDGWLWFLSSQWQQVPLGVDVSEALEAAVKRQDRTATFTTSSGDKYEADLKTMQATSDNAMHGTWVLQRQRVEDAGQFFALSYHEYIVYDVSQIRIRYLVQVKQ